MTGVDVWRADLDTCSFDSSWLPVAERERAGRLRSPPARSRWLASRSALRQVLATYLDQAAGRIELRLGAYGKPALADRAAGLRFNLSHSGGLALIAVSCESEVGIDVEECRGDRDFLRLAEVGLGPSGAAAVRGAPPEHRPEAFYAAWVRHEAVAKCLGAGLGRPLPEEPPTSVSDLDAGDRHAAALAVAGPTVPPVRRRTLAPA